jgi:hypothetical protein
MCSLYRGGLLRFKQELFRRYLKTNLSDFEIFNLNVPARKNENRDLACMRESFSHQPKVWALTQRKHMHYVYIVCSLCCFCDPSEKAEFTKSIHYIIPQKQIWFEFYQT